MSRHWHRLALATLAWAFTASASAMTVVFQDDFEGTLGAWTGVGGGGHNGQIVDDPLEADKALRFSATASGGDIFTSATFNSPAGQWRLEFDYLGLCLSGNCGGFIGYSQGLPGTHQWLAGSNNTSGADPILTNILEWQHFVINFSSAFDLHLMLEDFHNFTGTIGPNQPRDAYFDNIVLTAVPIPGTLALLLTPLAFLGVMARRRAA